MLSVLLVNLRFFCVLPNKSYLSSQDRLIPVYIQIYMNSFTYSVWQTHSNSVILYVFKGHWMCRHLWHFTNGTRWHFRDVGWQFVGLLFQLKYNLWKLQQLSKVLRMTPGGLVLVILLWLFTCNYVHFSDANTCRINPTIPLKVKRVLEWM